MGTRDHLLSSIISRYLMFSVLILIDNLEEQTESEEDEEEYDEFDEFEEE